MPITGEQHEGSQQLQQDAHGPASAGAPSPLEPQLPIDHWGSSSEPFRLQVTAANNGYRVEIRQFLRDQGVRINTGQLLTIADEYAGDDIRPPGIFSDQFNHPNMANGNYRWFDDGRPGAINVAEFSAHHRLNNIDYSDLDFQTQRTHHRSVVNTDFWSRNRSAGVTVRHETSHAFDDRAGRMSNSDNWHAMSNSPSFRQAYNADVSALGGPEAAKALGLEYQINNYLEDGGARGRKEVFAEIGAHHAGGGAYETVPTAFPRSSEWMREFNEGFAKAQREGPEAVKTFVTEFGENRPLRADTPEMDTLREGLQKASRNRPASAQEFFDRYHEQIIAKENFPTQIHEPLDPSVPLTETGNPRLGGINGALGYTAIGINVADALIKKDYVRAGEVGGGAIATHAGLKLIGKLGAAEAVPIAGEVVGAVFAGKDTYDAAMSGHTGRAAVSGLETGLYSVAAYSLGVAAFDWWNPTVLAPLAVAAVAGGTAVTITTAKGVYDNWNTVKGWFGYNDDRDRSSLSTNAPPTDADGWTALNMKRFADAKGNPEELEQLARDYKFKDLNEARAAAQNGYLNSGEFHLVQAAASRDHIDPWTFLGDVRKSQNDPNITGHQFAVFLTQHPDIMNSPAAAASLESNAPAAERRHFNKAQLIETQHILADTATVGEVEDVQRELRAEKLNIGKFGKDHDGVDGIAGRFTKTAIAAALKRMEQTSSL